MFIVEKNPKSVEAEAYRTLRTNIQYSSFDEEYRTIIVTSSEPGEGKSTTSGNLALALAQDGKKIVLIDCDLRKPTVHRKFKISNLTGLSDILLSKNKFQGEGYKYNDNLTIIPSGKIPPNPSEMLSSKKMSKFIEELKEEFDYIILDTPPVLAVTDAQILSTKADGVVLVVRAERTKKNHTREAIELLKKVRANIIGTVLNGASSGKTNYYYYEQK